MVISIQDISSIPSYCLTFPSTLLVNRRKNGQHPANFVGDWKGPFLSRADGGTSSPLGSQLSVTTSYSHFESGCDPTTLTVTKRSSTAHKTFWISLTHRIPCLPCFCKITQFAATHFEGTTTTSQAPLSCTALPFLSTFPNQTPAKPILHKLQQSFLKIPHKPYHSLAAYFWLSTEPLHINTRENTLTLH